MKLLTSCGAVVLAAATAMITSAVYSRDGEATSRPASGDPADGRPATDAESQVEIWARHAMPGKPHGLLERITGEWETLTTYRMKPDTETVDAKGTCKRKWILGRRFVQEDLDGGRLVMPFKGLGLYGYDAFEKKYTSAWMDTTSTAMMTYRGVYNKQNDAVRFVGEYGDPWTGVKKKCRGTLRFVDADKHVLELHVPDADGEEYKILEIVYTRKKDAPA